MVLCLWILKSRNKQIIKITYVHIITDSKIKIFLKFQGFSTGKCFTGKEIIIYLALPQAETAECTNGLKLANRRVCKFAFLQEVSSMAQWASQFKYTKTTRFQLNAILKNLLTKKENVRSSINILANKFSKTSSSDSPQQSYSFRGLGEMRDRNCIRILL